VVPAGVLRAGDNTVEVASLATQADFSLVTVDRVDLWYPRALAADDNRLHVQDELSAAGLQAGGFTTRDLVAYASDGAGNLARLAVSRRVDPSWREALASLRGEIQSLWGELWLAWWRRDGAELRRVRDELRAKWAAYRTLRREPSWQVTVPAVADTPGVSGVEYWVSSSSSVHRPRVLGAVVVPELVDEPADYLLIVHPSFMPASADDASHPLSRYIERRAGQGWEIRMVGTDAIQAAYGGGMALPGAVTKFLKAADAAFEYSHVLLVGGDSYDYLDHLGLGSLSFVPTVYTDTGLITHTPSDALLADLDGDGVSDKAIGRWPARTARGLEVMVAKTLDWESSAGGPRDARTSVWVTDHQDPDAPSFVDQAERMIDTLETPQAGGAGAPWPAENVTRIHLDEVQAGAGQSVMQTARGRLMEALSAPSGQTITGYVGHGGTRDWARGLLKAPDVAQMDNAGRPTLLSTLTCYTSYFVSTRTDTLAHWLMKGRVVDDAGEPVPGRNGAVAVHGAATLSSYSDNEKLARTALSHQMADGDTLGEAILKARRAAAAAGRTATAKNWTLLGDPTLTIEP